MGNVAGRVLAPLALVVAPLWSAPALAFTPADVVAATPESERTLRQAAEVTAAERALGAAAAGSRASLRAAPALTLGADVEDPAALSTSLDLGMELGWRYDRSRVLRGRAALLYARERLRHWRRADVRDALRLLGKALRAEVALARAELDLARARRAPAAAASTRRAAALVAARRHALDRLRADADALGFVGEASLEPFAFALPAPPEEPGARQRLVLALEAAHLERDAATTFDVLRDVSLEATYESKRDRFQLSASLSLDRGRPAATLRGEVGNQEDDQWSLRLSADVRLDAAAEDARAAADERVRRAGAALDALERGYPRSLREARTTVADARAALTAELAAWRQERAATPTGRPTTASACRSLLARENAVYAAWLDVVSATYGYLEAMDGAWAGAALGRGTAAQALGPGPAGAARGPGTAGGAPPPAAADAAEGAPPEMPADPSTRAAAWPVRPSTCAPVP